ncbi:MAG: HEAT repeat domain-containing protein [Candidatus Marinimicrobia bacterium]|nr:HEAT repeat domain-containing protein [Candidatus Neomarinimicrobiota bacterium]
MPKDDYNQTHLTDDQLRELFSPIKPVIKVDEQWLTAQRVRLEGAIELAGAGSWWSRFVEQVELWWQELPYYFSSARPAMAWGGTLVLGIIIGRFALTGGSFDALPGSTARDMNIAEMIRSGQIKEIDVGVSSDPDNPIMLKLTTGREMQLTGTTERDDILAALEYVLVRDPNPGQRLQSARILGGMGNLDSKESTVMALVSALLTDENPGVRLSIVGSLQGIDNPLAKNALIKTALEDASEGVRLASVEALGYFIADLSVRSALLLASRMDEAESVRYQAYQLLVESAGETYGEGLDILP